MITIANEDELLSTEFRVKVIKQIQSDHVQAFKTRKLKAYEIYKDLTKKWVIESICKEFSEKTVHQMIARASNISIARKIVDKKAKCYSGGVIRTIEGEEENTKKLAELAKFLSFDTVMKKADRFSELLKNVLLQVIYQNDAAETAPDGKPLKRQVNRILLPHQFDPICHAHDNTQLMAYVLSDFHDTKSLIVDNLFSDETGYRDPAQSQSVKAQGSMAKEKGEQKKICYIWWSGKYHFTTDDKGNYIDAMGPDEKKNPIQMLNAVSIHGDQDDGFWCVGGDDLIDGSILVNVLLTDLFSIMNVQGWGQLVVTGKKVPAEITGGPHRALVYEYDTGDPQPKVEYVSSNPPVDQWRETIAMYVALLLSTNGLSTNNVSTKLEGSSGQAASGVAMMLDSAESLEPVEDKQKMFQGAEKQAWKINFATQNYLFKTGLEVEEQKAIGEINTKKYVSLKFHQQKAIMTESEKAEILTKKKDSGLYRLVELLQIKNPDLSTEDAEKEAELLLADRMKYSVMYQSAVSGLVKKMNNDLGNGEANTAGDGDGKEEEKEEKNS